jgi:WD40 repeat protein
MNFINFEYLLTVILPQLFSGTVISLVIGSIVGSVIGLVFGRITRRTKATLVPAILGSSLGTLLFAMLPILSEPSLRNAGAYGGLVVLSMLVVGGVPGSIIGAIVGSVWGLKVPQRLKKRLLWIILASIYSLMSIVIYLRTAPTPFQFTQTPVEQDILPLKSKITGYDDPICCMAFTPNGQQLVVVDGGNVRVWQVNSGKLVHQFDSPPAPQTAMTMSPNGKTFITATLEDVQVRDLETGKILKQLEGQYYAQVTPDGKTLISFVAQPNTAKAEIGVWDMEQGKQRYRIPSEITPYLEDTSFAVSPDGKRLIIAPIPYTDRIEVWQLETGKRLTAWGGEPSERVTTLAVTPNGKTLIVATNNELRFLTLDKGKTVKVVPNVGEIKTLLFSPDGQTLISNGDSLSFWKVGTGEKLQSWPNELGKLANEVVLSPDGKTIAAYSGKVIKLWQMPLDKLK